MGVNLDLNFELFETAVLFISVIVVAFMLLVCSIFRTNYIWSDRLKPKHTCTMHLNSASNRTSFMVDMFSEISLVLIVED